MTTLHQTPTFTDWLHRLRDPMAKNRIITRLIAIQRGHMGDTENLGGGLHELRIFVGVGYRVYWTQRGDDIILLLCGGDKKSQPRDIQTARAMIKHLEH